MRTERELIQKAHLGTTSDTRLFSGEKRTSHFKRVKSVHDPACVKTRASRECAELFSPFSSFDCDCQRCSFPIQRNRDKISTRKFDVGVFTQAGPFAECARKLAKNRR